MIEIVGLKYYRNWQVHSAVAAIEQAGGKTVRDQQGRVCRVLLADSSLTTPRWPSLLPRFSRFPTFGRWTGCRTNPLGRFALWSPLPGAPAARQLPTPFRRQAASVWGTMSSSAG
jgi:hypothetical protein